MARPMDAARPGENEQDDWSEEASESDGIPEEEIGDDGDLHWIEHSREEPLNLRKNYAPHWNVRDGFREIYQNWYLWHFCSFR